MANTDETRLSEASSSILIVGYWDKNLLQNKLVLKVKKKAFTFPFLSNSLSPSASPSVVKCVAINNRYELPKQWEMTRYKMKSWFLSSPQLAWAPEFKGIKDIENGTNDHNNTLLMVLGHTSWYGLLLWDTVPSVPLRPLNIKYYFTKRWKSCLVSRAFWTSLDRMLIRYLLRVYSLWPVTENPYYTDVLV